MFALRPLALGLLCLGALSACGGTQSTVPATLPTPGATAVPTASPTPSGSTTTTLGGFLGARDRGAAGRERCDHDGHLRRGEPARGCDDRGQRVDHAAGRGRRAAGAQSPHAGGDPHDARVLHLGPLGDDHAERVPAVHRDASRAPPCRPERACTKRSSTLDLAAGLPARCRVRPERRDAQLDRLRADPASRQDVCLRDLPRNRRRAVTGPEHGARPRPRPARRARRQAPLRAPRRARCRARSSATREHHQGRRRVSWPAVRSTTAR